MRYYMELFFEAWLKLGTIVTALAVVTAVAGIASHEPHVARIALMVAIFAAISLLPIGFYGLLGGFRR